MSSSHKSDKKPHLCPPSEAVHPSDRWESLFIYSFICKFTNLRQKIEGLETPMDLENALLSKEPNSILSQLLVQFIVNLKPQTRNLSTDQISATVASVLSEYFKTSERTIFWDEELKANVDPFEGLEGGFFATNWDFKLKILRQLVELQLCHAPEIKGSIDHAWGVVHNKHKKNQTPLPPLDPADPKSQEKLQLLPIGQDAQRIRYWITDDSPRLYTSTNPWKITATFHTISSTREEYIATIDSLKASAPPEPKKGQKRTKLEQSHLALIVALEKRIEVIDAELNRVHKVRKKIEQRRMLLAQAEVRQTRTRRQTQKPDYVYNDDVDSEDDGGDEYTYQDEDGRDDEYDREFMNEANGVRRGRAGSSNVAPRRSTRTSTMNANGKRESSSDSWLWRSERRSSRLAGGEPLLDVVEPSRKRARTEESTTSTHSNDLAPPNSHGGSNGVRVKAAGAAALKPTEIALEQIAGKKRSKFWVYAVEPIPGAPPPLDISLTNEEASDINGQVVNNNDSKSSHSADSNTLDYNRSLEGSYSPMNSP